MKTKDIKSMLNKETEENTPDVLDNVKISPINKLKKNEKSMVAFKKTVATLTLVFLLVIVVVLSVAIHGYTTQSEETAQGNFTFMSVRISSSDDTEPRNVYNFVIDGNGKIVLIYNERTLSEMETSLGFDGTLSVMDYKAGDIIEIIASSDRPAFAKQFFGYMKELIEADSRFSNAIIRSHINDDISKEACRNSVSALPGFDKKDISNKKINELCALYVELAK